MSVGAFFNDRNFIGLSGIYLQSKKKWGENKVTGKDGHLEQSHIIFVGNKVEIKIKHGYRA